MSIPVHGVVEYGGSFLTLALEHHRKPWGCRQLLRPRQANNARIELRWLRWQTARHVRVAMSHRGPGTLSYMNTGD
jgi:hypothetical protein